MAATQQGIKKGTINNRCQKADVHNTGFLASPCFSLQQLSLQPPQCMVANGEEAPTLLLRRQFEC